MKKDNLQIDTKKIGKLLKSIDGAEYIYMRHCMDMRDNFQKLIKRSNLSRLEFCSLFKIKPEKYRDYIMGNCVYSTYDMAKLNAAYLELETKKLKENEPVKVVAQ